MLSFGAAAPLLKDGMTVGSSLNSALAASVADMRATSCPGCAQHEHARGSFDPPKSDRAKAALD